MSLGVDAGWFIFFALFIGCAQSGIGVSAKLTTPNFRYG
jgi:hypothetical protein